MTSALQLPNELWLQVFSFLSWKDKLSMRCTCSHFKQLLDECRPLWRGFSVVLKDLSRYNRAFWRSLARRQLDSVALRGGRKRDLKLLSVWLPLLQALRLDTWRGNDVQELKRFRHVHSLTVTACSEPLVNLEFLLPLGQQLTQLSLCNVQLACPPSQLLASLSRLTRLRSLVLHHDGCLKIPTLRGVLSQLVNLNSLSWTMINYKRLTQDFFCPATGPGGHPLVVYADFLPSSLRSLTLCVDLQPEDLQIVSFRAPNLRHLHLEPWSSSSKLVRLLPQLFPGLRTLAIRHHHASDEDFLGLHRLQHLNTLEVLDSFYRPDPKDPSLVVNKPSPRLLQLISDLQKLTNHKVRVLTSSHIDLLPCGCV
uniref:F-box domain-containing protein n=1 Tax=Poecilia mexicana TaxID=48701 RepID=A0A3B3YHH1_9TELE